MPNVGRKTLLHNRGVICLRCIYYVLMSKWHKDCLFGQMQMLFVCFHFLPLLHKRPAMSPRQAEQPSSARLSSSLPAMLQFRSRTLLNPNGAGGGKRLCVFPCSKRELEGQNFPERSEGVATLIPPPPISQPPLCPPSLCELNSCTGLLISQEYAVLKVDYRCF